MKNYKSKEKNTLNLCNKKNTDEINRALILIQIILWSGIIIFYFWSCSIQFDDPKYFLKLQYRSSSICGFIILQRLYTLPDWIDSYRLFICIFHERNINYNLLFFRRIGYIILDITTILMLTVFLIEVDWVYVLSPGCLAIIIFFVYKIFMRIYSNRI